MSKPIYTITTVGRSLSLNVRAVGFSYKLDDAIQWVSENIMDINECETYPYVVIESIQEGIYTFPREELWFEWIREIDKYQRCSKPQRFKKTICWGLG